jgi:hypothetical protein
MFTNGKDNNFRTALIKWQNFGLINFIAMTADYFPSSYIVRFFQFGVANGFNNYSSNAFLLTRLNNFRGMKHRRRDGKMIAGAVSE